MRTFLSIPFIFIACAVYADDPLDNLSGTEEWDREEEIKRQSIILAQKKKLMSEEFYKTRTRISGLTIEWQKDLSKFQEIKRSISDILFQEEAKNYQQVNVKEKILPKEIKRMPARDEGVSIETGGPIIEKTQTIEPEVKSVQKIESTPVIISPVVAPVPPPKKEEPTPEDILKKQKGHFDDKGQFIDEELNQESDSKGKKDTDIDYDSP